jgi:hypothetical protein
MRKQTKIFIGVLLSSLISTSYAINVNVQSTSRNISGLGFTVNGKNHGGMGSNYRATNMPTGKYTFGIRVGGSVFGKDVPCHPNNGHSYVILKQDTNALLEYNGKTCMLSLR